jgi:hypothetical protein
MSSIVKTKDGREIDFDKLQIKIVNNPDGTIAYMWVETDQGFRYKYTMTYDGDGNPLTLGGTGGWEPF